MTRLVEIDENNVVIAIHTPNLPLRTQLSDRFCVAPDHVEKGWDYHPETEKFSPPGRRRWLTNLAFDNRFTVTERVNIELASLIEPGMTQEQKRQALELRVELERAKKATYTDLDRADTRAGVQKFEAFNLIGPGRAAEILDGPIAEHEFHPDA